MSDNHDTYVYVPESDSDEAFTTRAKKSREGFNKLSEVVGADENTKKKAVGTGVGAAVGALIGSCFGKEVGTAIGGVVGALVGNIVVDKNSNED